MATVDYESAWHDLAEKIAARPSGWGTRQLLAEMTAVQAKHRVGESLLDRVVRLYGIERLLARIIKNGDQTSGLGGTTPTEARVTAPATEDPEEDRDGSRSAEPVHA
ncbi:MAG TPA: hypothetical protein VF192_01265 [Longimicrobiales bacterium]